MIDVSDLDNESEPAPGPTLEPDEPSVEDDLALIEGVATELESVEAELAAMDEARDADPAHGG